MDADVLRQLQAPLKARYQEHPEQGRVTLRARGRVEQATLSCRIEGGKPGLREALGDEREHRRRLGQDPARGHHRGHPPLRVYC